MTITSEPTQRQRDAAVVEAPGRAIRVPGAIAVALQTGRPELVRLGMQGVLAQVKGTPLEEVAHGLVGFAEGAVNDIQNERNVIADVMLKSIDASGALRGALAQVERLRAAVQALQRGANAEDVRDMLLSNSERAERS